ncbi:hypothetical protein [Pandoraea sp.]|uniref:hypothetical protein n=1 Tax=Pandoraea sp. TaxID=1883445 RepID=UPI0011FC3681|nr:hypothetical protein [Pandoraea sp.]TAL53803.1 MAG: hypothetical protein EPN80_14140 [Pandoraea sp.]TAM17056.1 MAG: hypothetical protein EPN65_12310 [Pandoraea sp.]
MGEARRRAERDPTFGQIRKITDYDREFAPDSPLEKFLYLTHIEWSNAWVEGGDVPISLASSYLGDTRDGIYTPDENRIHDSPVDLTSLRPAIRVENVKNFTFVGCTINGQRVPDIVNANYYLEDGIILSFCNVLNGAIARRLRKKACVKIRNIQELKAEIDRQIGKAGIIGDCRYTNDHQRNHFLKSSADAWQKEHRIFWREAEGRKVKIPAGTATLVATF